MIAAATLAGWALGWVVLALELAAVVVVARRLRAWLMPGSGGPADALATVVLGIALTFGTGFLLGTIGLFRAVPVAVVLIGAGLAVALANRTQRVAGPHRVRRPLGMPPPVAIAAATFVAIVVTVWVVQVVANYRKGVYDGDSLWYHAPFSARFVQTGWVTQLHDVNADPLITFFPANSELLDAMFMLPFGHDGLLPLINLGWLALLLTAGWTAGASRGQPVAGLTITAGIAAVPVVLLTQAGTARNDIAGYALLATSIVLAGEPPSVLRQATIDDPSAGVPHVDAGSARGRAAVGREIVVGVALGLAVGVKVSLLAPVGLTLLGVIAVRWWEGRRAAAPAIVATLAAFVTFGAPWYLRNWIRVGNPLPWFGVHAGPIRFVKTPIPGNTLTDSSLAHRLDEPAWWSALVRPGLKVAMGWGWWIVVAALVVAIAAAAARPAATAASAARTRILVGVAVVAAVVYVRTPNSAPLPVGQPLAALIFAFNTRYLFPAIVVALIVATRALRERWLWAVAGLLAAAGLIGLWPGRIHEDFEWSSSQGDLVVGALVVLVGGALLAGGVAVVRRRPPQHRWMASGIGAIVVLGALWGVVDRHFEHRWRVEPPPFAAAGAWTFAADVHDARIGIAGDFFQYPYVGADLSNRVQYLGVPGPRGAFREAQTCREWRRAIVAADVDYVVVTQQIFGSDPALDRVGWTESDIAATRLAAQPGADVFAIEGRMDPDACA